MRFGFPAWVRGVICALAVSSAGPVNAATINVPAGGDLQQAINTAQPGDVITLAPGAVYVGNFVLPNKGALTNYITIRTATPDASLPPANVRITPAYAAVLAKIKSSNNMSALRTQAGANHYALMFLEFQANVGGYGDVIALGAGDSTQTTLTQVPYAFVVDRVYVHGDPVTGQKRGIALHSSDTTVVNSYISECKVVGQDSQAISGYNGPGNYLIENNYLEGAGENFLLGGADPTIPNLVTANVTFRRNYLSKPVAWMNPIIATPAAVSAAAAPGSGSLSAGTYYYKVAARVPAGQTTKANSSASAEVSATLAAAGAVTISWTPVVGAADYVVYGRTAGGENVYWTTTNPYFTDTGAGGSSGTPPSATKWSVKNAFELKNAQDVLVEGNVFENVWVGGQPGYPIVFTPRNQGGTAPWVIVQRVTFQHNLVRHTAGGVNILGVDNLAPSQRTNHITVRDNIFDDMNGTTWGSGSRPFQLGDGPDVVAIDHNTVITNDSTIVWLYGAPTTNGVYTNNMSAHNSYGINGNNSSSGTTAINTYMPAGAVVANVLAGGTASKYPAGNFFPAVSAWQGNFVDYAGGDYRLTAASVYRNAGTDGTDLGADVNGITAQAANALSGDNRLAPGTSKVQITTTSLPDGVMNQPYAQTLACSASQCGWQIVDSTLPAGLSFDTGAATVTGTPSAVQTGNITVLAYDAAAPANTATTTLTVTVDAPPFVMTMPPAPDAQVGVPYSLSPTVTGAMGAVSWLILPGGSLPDGLGLDPASGAIAGTPTRFGTFSAVVQAQDTWAADRTASATVTIVVKPAQLVITTTTLGSGMYQQPFQAALAATGGTGVTNWSAIGLPGGLSLASDGSVSGTPATPGTFSVSVQAIDANDPTNTTSAALPLVIAAPPFTITAPSSAAGQVGVPLQFQVLVNGNVGTVSWTLAGLPAGVAMDMNGFVSGSPASYGTFQATFQALDSYDASRVASATTTVSVAPPSFSIATTTLADGKVGQVYAATLATAGGTGSATWSVSSGTLPAGLSLGSNGSISGTPAAAGTSSFTVSASDSGWPAYVTSRSMTINVAAAAASTETTLLDDTFATLDRVKWPGGSITGGTDTTVSIAVAGGVFVVGPLKASTTGTHYNGISTAAYDLTAGGGASVQLVQAAAADSYTMFAAASDTNNFYRWYVSAGQLSAERKVAGTKAALMTAAYNPSGQQFLRIRNDVHAGLSDVVFETASSASGPFTVFYRESWNPQIAAGALKFELKAGTSTSIASPGSAKFDNFHLSVPVTAPPLSIATTALSDGQVRQAYQSTLSATGGSGAAAWSVSSGVVPAGMALSANGVLSGTPTAVGTSSFTVTATDSGASASKALTLTVAEQTLLADTFDAIDRARWPGALFTSASDATMPVTAAGGTLQIGLLASAIGTHYNGISSPAYDLTGGGAAFVQLTQPGNGASYAMFAAGSDGSNYYRWYVSAGQLVAERRIAGTKKTVLAGTYDPAAHQFLRIRGDLNAATGTTDVVFETAPNAGGAPGTFTEFYREPWDARVIPGAVKFELKAGTSDAIASPGSVRFDNFMASRR
jgi:hypothetical protein